jgi:hypothetical protein
MIANFASNTPFIGKLRPDAYKWRFGLLLMDRDLAVHSRRYGTVLYRIATGSEPASYTFTTTSAVSSAGIIMAFFWGKIYSGADHH